MIFEPYGPYTLPEVRDEIDDSGKNSFWDAVREDCTLLPGAVGCYIFATKAAKGFRPWYVGKTERQCFRDETWQVGKLRLYEKVLRRHKGTPVLFLLAKRTPGGKFVKPTKRKKASGSISALEEMLVGVCLQRNPDLLNKMLTRYRAIYVPGYLNEKPGARTKRAKALARLLRTDEGKA
jgi:hypothetical protein